MISSASPWRRQAAMPFRMFGVSFPVFGSRRQTGANAIAFCPTIPRTSEWDSGTARHGCASKTHARGARSRTGPVRAYGDRTILGHHDSVLSEAEPVVELSKCREPKIVKCPVCDGDTSHHRV